jgi:hypothetical protein
MRKSAKFSLFVLAAVALSAQTPPPPHGGFGPRFGMMSMGPGSRTPVTGAPYSAVETVQIQQTLADGNQITRQETSKVFRDSQGRVRTERAASGQSPAVIAIFDPVAGFSHVLNPSSMTAIKTSIHIRNGSQGDFGPHPRGKRGEASGAQVQTEDLGTQIINGISATGTKTTRTIPAGAIGNQQAIQVVHEAWISTDLKVPVLIKTSDPRFGNTVMQLTGIARSEPDAALFQVPSGYTVTTGPARPNRMGIPQRAQ